MSGLIASVTAIVAALTGGLGHPSTTGDIDAGCATDTCWSQDESPSLPSTRGEEVSVSQPRHAPPVQRTTAPFCEGMANMPDAARMEPAPPACSPAFPEIPVVQCAPGQFPIQALWQRAADADGVWGLWGPVRGSYCDTDAMAVEAAREFQTLVIDPVQVTIQPDESVFFTQMPVIVYVDPAEQTVSRTLLGQPVLITAVPTTYTWNWGDQQTTTTADPGKPWPDHTVSHTYERTRDDYDVTIIPTTTWNGYYSLDNGATWVLIPGTATTTSPPVTLTAHTLHTRLVTCDLDGNCYD